LLVRRVVVACNRNCNPLSPRAPPLPSSLTALDSIHRNPLLLKPAQAQTWGRGGEGGSSSRSRRRAHSLRTRGLLLLEEAVVLSRHRKEEVVGGTRGAHLLFTRPTSSSPGVALESIRAGDMLAVAVELERGRNSTHVLVLVLLRVARGHPQDHQALWLPSCAKQCKLHMSFLKPHHCRQVLHNHHPRFSPWRSTNSLQATRLCLQFPPQASHSGFLCAQEKVVLAPGVWLRPIISLPNFQTGIFITTMSLSHRKLHHEFLVEP